MSDGSVGLRAIPDARPVRPSAPLAGADAALRARLYPARPLVPDRLSTVNPVTTRAETTQGPASRNGHAAYGLKPSARRHGGMGRGLAVYDLLVTLAILSLMRDGGGHDTVSAMTWTSNAGLLFAAFATVLSLGAIGAYDPTTRVPGARLRTMAHLALVGCAAAVIAALVSGAFGGTVDADCLALVALVLPAAWIGARIVVAAVERSHPARALVIGTGATATHVWDLSQRHRECAFEVVGFVDDEPLPLPPGAPPALGCLDELPRLVAEFGVERVIVAYANAIDTDVLALLRALDPGVRIQVVPRLFELVQARGFELGRISVLEAGGSVPSRAERHLKRGVDILAATLLLLFASPLLLAIAIAIKLEGPGPVLFRQRRVGLHNGIFEMLKFRTMSVDAERQGHEMIEGLPIESAVRELKARSAELHVTRTGRRLRAHSLDELPQLWNVIRGQMALVGPRPMPEYEVYGLTDWQLATRHSVRPGITGLWQVSGRSSIGWDERIQLDCVYARHWSVTTDLRILARTVAAVVRADDTV